MSELDRFNRDSDVYSRKTRLLNNLASRANSDIKRINTVNDNTLTYLDRFAASAYHIRNRMREAVDLYTLVSSITGNSNTDEEMTDRMVYSSRNVIVSKDLIMLESDIKTSYTIKDILIDTNGLFGNSCDYLQKRYFDPNSIPTTNRFELESIDTGVISAFNISLMDRCVCNQVRFRIEEFGVNYPEVSGVEISYNRESYERIDHQVVVINKEMIISFVDKEITNIRFTLTQTDGYVAKDGRNRYAVGVSKLLVGVSGAKESGEVIFGPISHKEEILKASIQAAIDNDGYSIDNTKFFISNDLDKWTEIAIPTSISKAPKIIEYNTISTASITTPAEVHALYLKIELVAAKQEKNYRFGHSFNVHSQRLSSDYPNITLPFSLGKEYMVGEDMQTYYGGRISRREFSINTDIEDSILYINTNNSYKIRTLEDTRISQKATVSFGYRKCSVATNDKFDIDPVIDVNTHDIRFYNFSEPTKKDIQVNEFLVTRPDNKFLCVLPFSEVAGVYTISDGKKFFKLDLRAGFFASCYQYVYQTSARPIQLLDPLGITVYEWKDSGEYINLLDYFTVEEPKHTDDSTVALSFNRKFPEGELDSNDFTIFNYGVKTNLSAGTISMYVVQKTPIKHEVMFGHKKPIFQTSYISTAKGEEQLSRFDGKTTAKLRMSNVSRNTVKFDYSSASIFSFVREVEFINGRDEFQKGNKREIDIPKNVYEFSLGTKVDKFSDLKFTGYTALFVNKVFSKNELLNAGDYMLEDRDNKTFIILPEGIKTHDIIKTSVTIDTPISSAGSGYFSIDYENGMLHSQTIIDGNIKVSYIYSNVFMEGSRLKGYPKDRYTVSNSGREIKFGNIPDGKNIVVVSSTYQDRNISLTKSPVVSNVMFNMITGGVS